MGPCDVRYTRCGSGRPVGDDRSSRDQLGASGSARQFLLRRLAGRRDLREDGSARQPDRPAAPVESDDHAATAEARLRRAAYVGAVATLVRQADRRAPRTRHRRRAARSLLGDRARRRVNCGGVRATGTSVKIALPKTANLPEMEFEWKIPKWSNTLERNRARSYFQAYSAALALEFAERGLREVLAGRTKTWSQFQVPNEAIGF